MKRVLMGTVMGLCLSLSAMAAPSIGVLDVHKVLEKAPEMKTIRSDLTSKFKSRQEALQQANKMLRSKMDDLYKNGTVMSENDRQKLQETIAKDRRDVVRMQQNLQDDLTLAQNQAVQGLLSKVNKVVISLAKKGKYDVVLQKDGLAYASEKVDITQAVLDKLG